MARRRSTNARWRISAPKWGGVKTTYTLIDQQSGYRRHFLSRHAAVRVRDQFVREALERQAHQVIAMPAPPLPPGTEACARCRTPFTPKRPWQKFCGDDCRVADWQATHLMKRPKTEAS
jgi:hypothetical protein